MKLPEIWDDFSKGMWVSRKAWKKDYAVAICNLKCSPETPVLMHDTYGYLFDFDCNLTEKVWRRGITGKYKWRSGLQYTLLADDWYVCDQTVCEMRLKEAEK
jgi:hypothetical protein